MFLPNNYRSPKNHRKVPGTDEVVKSREAYFRDRPNNLKYLIHKRYGWMKPYLKNSKDIVELGAGAGFSKEVFNGKNVKLTDVANFPWLDHQIDALALPFPDQSLDAIICSCMIHHLSSPATFFDEAARVLRPGGHILINEVHDSFLMKLMILVTRHEGWSYDLDIFDKTAVAKDPKDEWDGNNAIADLLFSDRAKFENNFPELKIKKDKYVEFLVFLISGGVTAKFKTIQLPDFLLRALDIIDRAIIKIFPHFFALTRRIVIEKTGILSKPGKFDS